MNLEGQNKLATEAKAANSVDSDTRASGLQPADTVDFKFSDDQLEKVLTAFAPKHDPTFPFDKLLQVLQVISIAGAAAWTLYNYLTFEREEHVVSAKIQQINRDQQEFTLKQGQMLAENQRALAVISLKQQEFSLNQQQLLASSARDKAKLDVRALELENLLKGYQIRTQVQTPLRYQARLKLYKTSIGPEQEGYGEWKAQLYIFVGNISTSEFFLNAGRISQYLGSVQAENQSAHIERFNDPDESTGPIKWEKVGSTDYCSIERCRDLFEGKLPGGWAVGGPAFGRMQRDEGNIYSAAYQIRAKNHSIVGFIVHLDVEQNQKPWLWQIIVERSTDDETESVIDSQLSPKMN